MNKLLFILPFCLFLGCAPSIPKPSEYKSMSYIDYESYFKNGFYLTESNSVGFEYIPMGTVNYILMGGYKTSKVEEKTEINPDAKFSVKEKRKKTDTYLLTREEYSVYEAIDQVVNECKKKGANGIINLRINVVTGDYATTGYTISGMAIKKTK